MWDLDVFFFQPQPLGEEAPMVWPGFWVGKAPKKATRSRRRDALWLYLAVDGPSVVSPRALEQMTQQAAETYFASSGSVTAAMRRAAEVLHRRLRRANERLTRRGETLVGHFLLAVWRGEVLYLGWSGAWHVLAAGPERQRWHDPELAGPGLGVQETFSLKFAQTAFRQPLAVLAADDLEPWQDEDAHRLLQEPESALRAWLQRVPRPRRGVLAVWEPGAYEVRKKYLPLVLPRESPTAPEDQAAPLPRPEQPPSQKTAPSLQPQAPPRPKPARPRPMPSPQPVEGKTPRPRKDTPGMPRTRTSAWGSRLMAYLARGLAWNPPTRPLMALSLALPLLVLGLTLFFYLREGRWLRHRQWLSLAYQQAREAVALPDPYQKGPAMEEALATLRRAEEYAVSSESEALRREMERWLQQWEGIRWLDPKPVLTTEMPDDVQMDRLLPGDMGLFALDRQGDRVLFFLKHGNEHAFTYEPDFRCAGSRRYQNLNIGTLVDMVTVTGRPLDFHVAAFDAQGRWMRCALERPPQVHLLPMPPTHWGEIYRTRVVEDDVYLLDRGQNNVFVVNLRQPQAAVPKTLFPPDQGPDLSHVLDFDVLRGELFFLFVDGQVMRCEFRLTEASTQCEYLKYRDRRPEREDRTFEVFPNTRFQQMMIYTGPEPGLLLLDAERSAIYRFTLKLRFVEQYRPRQPWPGEVRSFTVSDLFLRRPWLYLIVENTIHAAPLP